jgi:nucleotide-binding universal stress UspA family protein
MGVAMLPAADEMTASAHKLLDEVVKQAGGAGVVKVTYKIVRGAPATALLDASKRVDVLVIGRRGHGGFLGLLLGSVAQQVVHHAECPVVVVPA